MFGLDQGCLHTPRTALRPVTLTVPCPSANPSSSSCSSLPQPRAGRSAVALPSLRSAQVFCTAIAQKKTFSTIDEMLAESDTPILVDFYATWCGPCQMMSNILKDISKSFSSEELQVFKIDTDKYPALASRFKVQGLPTLLLFKEGKVVDRIEGVMDQRSLSHRLRYYMRGLQSKFGRSQ